jgi:methyl-accepting chemotaxis protein
MKIKIKLSIIVIAIVVAVAGGVAILLLREASGISLELSKAGIRYLVREQTAYWKGIEDSYIRMLRTLSSVMSEYENVPATDRRDKFDSLLHDVMIYEPTMINLYTVWKPDAVDGMDSEYIGRTGSGPTGQYAVTYTRESGRISSRTTVDIDASMAYITGPNALRDRVEHPIARVIDGKETHLLRIMVPVINPRTKEVVGGVGCLFTIDSIQPIITDTIKGNEEIAAMTIFAGNGLILGHLLPDRVGKMLIDVETVFGSRIEEADQAVQDGREFQCRTYSPELGEDVEVLMLPFQIGSSDRTWSIMVVVTEKYIMRKVDAITKFTIILAAIAVMVSAIIVYFCLSATTKPIVRVADTLKDISEGEGDLTRTIAIHSKDEVGDLAKYFNKTLEKIKNLIIIIKQQVSALTDQGSTLSSSMTETAAAINEITATIQNLKNRIINQSASVNETKASIEEMVATNRSIAGTLGKNVENIQTLNASSEQGRVGLHGVADDIKQIGRESEGLLEINAVMENIASQTNLLSMNAAIEAAHAGEAGKGFAVVADEIRKLADSSHEQSKTTVTVLKRIKESIDKITGSTESVLHEFENIEQNIKNVTQQADHIQKAMEEQVEGSKKVLSESENLARITEETTSGMNEMASGADQVNVAVNNVNEISSKNHEGIETLMREISRFKVE